MKRTVFCTLLLAFSLTYGSAKPDKGYHVTLDNLLDEMLSVEQQARIPYPSYKSGQVSSYDRRSVSPENDGWFANNDGFGIERTDTIDGRIEKVMFDEAGPGVITRIWITTLDKRGTWRFYFDGDDTPGLVIPAYDLMKLEIPEIKNGLVMAHTSYTPEGKGGNTSFLPIPYGKSCKVTFEDEPGINPTPKYYHINFRKYPENVSVETFSYNTLEKARKKLAATNSSLLNPATIYGKRFKTISGMKTIPPNDSLVLKLPKGNRAIYEIRFNVSVKNPDDYAAIMRQLIFQAEFDKKQTVWVPLSDYSGGGMGAPVVESWYLSSDGNGKITSRWLMPYSKSGELAIRNLSSSDVTVEMTVKVAKLKWDGRSLYFHASWRQQDSIYIHNNYDEDAKCIDWNFATIHGKGIYKGDLLSLFNHAPRWYGEGDEKIWVDGDTFPSHFGTGTEDYYNSSWAPVYPFHTPFGGAPRADKETSHGYNAFYRTRHLDAIPFENTFKFDIEMLGWDPGYVDYSTTTYWYGDYDAKAIGTSGIPNALKPLLPSDL